MIKTNTATRARQAQQAQSPRLHRWVIALGLAVSLGAAPLAAQEQPAAPADNGEQQMITLNLTDADISALINTVAAVTGRKFIVDPRVNAKVTVISKQPMPADELYRVFLSVLQVHGFSAVPAGEVTKIIPDINAKQVGIPTGAAEDPQATDEMVTRVIRVENVPVAQLVPILRPLVPQQGHLAAYPPTNVLIISDRAGNIDRMQDLIARIDRASDDEVEVIRLEHASAPEVARIIASLQQGGPEGGPGPALKIAADERTNSILLSGDRSERLRLRSMIAQLDTQLETDGDTRVIYLRYANAKELVPVLTGVSEQIVQTEGGEGAPKAGAAKENISIQAEESTNALVISAPPKVQRSLEAVVRQLDVRRAQVLVEAAIAEIQFNKDREVGVDVGFMDSEGERPALVSLLGALTPGVAGLFAADTPTELATAAINTTGFNMAVGDTNGRYRFGALIRALATDTNSNILSTPSVVTLDNEEAEIRVAQNVPFVTGQYTNEGQNTTNPFTTVEREDVGIILKVKPQINEGNDILLAIEQEVSNVVGTGDLGPTTSKRSIKTTIMVEDGQLLALGGLIDEQVQEGTRKVPVLGDVPVVGELFKSRSASKGKRNLVLFLQPSILRDEAVTNAYTGRKYNFFRAQQLEQQKRGIQLMGNEQAPILPKLERPDIPAPFGAETDE